MTSFSRRGEDPGQKDPGRATGLSPMEVAFYGPEACRVAPSSPEELAELIREAEGSGRPIVPSGHGVHAYLGNPPPPGARVVSLSRLRKILHYEPDDFVVSVQAGAALDDLRRILGENGQEIPADVSAGAPGTVGGLVAAARPGPRTGSLGPLRSHVAGIRGSCSGGRPIPGGSGVLRRAAGYDVAKLFTGALGTAGCIVEVHLKVKPIPALRKAGMAGLSSSPQAWELVRGLRKLQLAVVWKLSTGALPAPGTRGLLDGSFPHTVVWVLEGNPGAVDCQERAAQACLARASPDASRRLDADGAESLLELLSSASDPGTMPPMDLGIACLAPLPSQARSVEEAILSASGEIPDVGASVAADGLTGLVTVRWSGPPTVLGAFLAVLRKIARDARVGGRLLYLPPRERQSQEYLLADDPSIHVAERILHVFDPAGIFAPGRIFRRRGSGGVREAPPRDPP